MPTCMSSIVDATVCSTQVETGFRLHSKAAERGGARRVSSMRARSAAAEKPTSNNLEGVRMTNGVRVEISPNARSPGANAAPGPPLARCRSPSSGAASSSSPVSSLGPTPLARQQDLQRRREPRDHEAAGKSADRDPRHRHWWCSSHSIDRHANAFDHSSRRADHPLGLGTERPSLGRHRGQPFSLCDRLDGHLRARFRARPGSSPKAKVVP